MSLDPTKMPFSLGTQFVIIDDDYDIKGSFGCPDKACRFALASEVVVKCRLAPLEIIENKYETKEIRKETRV